MSSTKKINAPFEYLLTREDPLVHDGLVEERPEERHLRLPVDLHAEEPVVQRVDDDEHVAELGGEDAPAVVARMLRPDDVDLVVAQVARLAQSVLLCGRGHPGRHVEHHLHEGGGEVGGGLARGARALQAAHEARVGLELDLPGQARDELLICLIFDKINTKINQKCKKKLEDIPLTWLPLEFPSMLCLSSCPSAT